ncbi:MAG: endolytic transglycosylase MltG [Armatimonadota bacterium]
MKRWLLAAIVIVLVVIGGAVLLGINWYREGIAPADPSGEPKLVQIPEGSSVAEIVGLLHEEALIRDDRAFTLMLRFKDLAGRLQAGVFEISPAMTGEEIAWQIASGEVAIRRLTVPEGLRLTEIAERVEGAGLVMSVEDFVEAAVASTVASETKMPLPEGSLEGYLFPETYDFCCDFRPEPIIITMVSELESRFYQPHREEIEARGLTLHEIVTLASLIEHEARVAEERPLIAGVIQNRLDSGMKLQIDATVQYALPEHKERLLFEDLEVASPYNTYLHSGLPPGPIASPGLSSLLAALRPAETDAFFYVARPDGTHVFTPNYQEHLRAIERIRGR